MNFSLESKDLLLYKYQEVRKNPYLLIIFDRDGILNVDEGYSYDKANLILSPGVVETFTYLRDKNIEIAVATNQSGIARKLYSRKQMEDFNFELWNELKSQTGVSFTFLAACPHSPDNGCLCRKPKPGLLEAITSCYSVPKKRIAFFGDQFTDYMAGVNCGLESFRVQSCNLELEVKEWVQTFDFN